MYYSNGIFRFPESGFSPLKVRIATWVNFFVYYGFFCQVMDYPIVISLTWFLSQIFKVLWGCFEWLRSIFSSKFYQLHFTGMFLYLRLLFLSSLKPLILVMLFWYTMLAKVLQFVLISISFAFIFFACYIELMIGWHSYAMGFLKTLYFQVAKVVISLVSFLNHAPVFYSPSYGDLNR